LEGKFPSQNIAQDPDAPIHLQLNSQQPGVNTLGGYTRDARDGEGIYIYVVDTGFTRIDEFSEIPEIESLNGDETLDHDTGDSHPEAHGTKVAALAVGKTYGVARKASLVTIKINGNPKDLEWPHASKAIKRAIEHIKSHNRQGKSVINLSSGGFIFCKS
jgi:oryzin